MHKTLTVPPNYLVRGCLDGYDPYSIEGYRVEPALRDVGKRGLAALQRTPDPERELNASEEELDDEGAEVVLVDDIVSCMLATASADAVAMNGSGIPGTIAYGVLNTDDDETIFYKMSKSCTLPESAFYGAGFRSKTWGAGKCKGSKYDRVKNAFGWAYLVCRAAELEIEEMANRPPTDRIAYWHGYVSVSQSAPERWFGNYQAPSFSTRFETLRQGLRLWSHAFRHGFSNDNDQVYIRCKTVNCIGGARARHIIPSMIEICPPWFDDANAVERMITVLHEMGHHAFGSILHPRDERYSGVCTGGWNIAENMCYRGSRTNTDGTGVYVVGNPRNLVLEFEDGDSEALSTLLNNIDNYVCFMWNRWVDRGACMLTMDVTTNPDLSP